MTARPDRSIHELPLDVLEQVHELCERFERSWQSGSVPSLEAHLEQGAAPGRLALFQELLALEVEYRRGLGETPAVDEYLRRFPDLSGAIHHSWPPLEDCPQAPPPRLGDFRIIREIGRGGMSVVYLAEQMSLGRRVAIKILSQATVLDPVRRERFQRESRSAASLQHANIVPVFGVGCDQGVYYYVMLYIDGESLDKIIIRLRNSKERNGEFKSLLAATPLAEFEQRERKQDNDAAPIAGPTTACSSGNSGDSTDRAYFKNVARIIRQAASGLHHAHQEGILHRDVKSSNLLLDKTGKLWIADFGLAKSLTDTEKLTQTGDVAGTLQYMAPETFQGNADVRSDLYGLGLTLYELLTLRRPFDATDRARLIDQVLRSEPVAPRRHNPRIPRDLETVCLKCIQKEPRERYQTAADLADDLQRFVEGKSIRARPVSVLTRMVLWARRRPAIAVLIILVLVMTIGALSGLTWATVATTRWALEAEASAEANRQKLIAQRQRADLESKRANAESARSEIERLRASEARAARYREQQLRQQIEASLVYARVAMAERSWLAGEMVAAQRSLELCIPQPGEPDLRGWEWHYVNQLCHSELAVWPHRFWVNAVAFNPDGRWLASAAGSPGHGKGDAQRDSELKIWEVGNNKLIATLLAADEPAPAVVEVEFSPAGRWLLAGNAAGRWHVWDTQDWERHVSVTGLDAACLHDERTLGVIGPQGELRHYGLPSGSDHGTVREPLTAFGDRLTGSFSSDGRFAVLRAYDYGTAFVIESETGQEVARVEVPPSPAAAVVDPRGKRVITAEHLWDVTTGSNLGLMARQLGEPIYVPAFSPDGGWLAWTSNPRSTPLLAPADSKLSPQSLQQHLGRVNAMAFAPQSEFLATASSDATVGLWHVETRSLSNVFRGHGSGVQDVAFSPDGKLIASASQDGTVRLWSATHNPRGRVIRLPHSFGENVSDFVFSADGEKLVVAQHHSQFLLDLATGQNEAGQTHDLRGSILVPRSETAFSADGTILVSASQSAPDVVKVWRGAASAGQGQPARSSQHAAGGASPYLMHSLRGHTAPVRCVAVDEAGRRVASLAFEDSARHAELIVWNHAGQQLRTWQATPATCLALSENGLLAAAGDNGQICLWDLENDGQQTGLAAPATGVQYLRFSAAGRRLAAATPVGVAIWEIPSGERLLLKTSSTEVTGVAFSPDGTRVATIGRDEGVVHLWDSTTGEHVFSLRSLSSTRPAAYTFMARIVFSPCGRHIAANNWDASLNVWSLGP